MSRILRAKHPPRDFHGFNMITRVRYMDENILRKELDKDYKMYDIPDGVKTVIDIGAHIGGTSVLAASMGAKVYAFEPEDYNYELLCENVKLNNVDHLVECVNKGVGCPGTVEFFVHNKNSGGASTEMWPGHTYPEDNRQLATIISISDVFKEYGIEECDLLKMDCEGCEECIIRDLDDEIAGKIKQISLEFHNSETRNELINILSRWFGFKRRSHSEWIFKKI